MSTFDIKFFTDEELEQFFNGLEKNIELTTNNRGRKRAIRDNAIFRVMHYCALRISEVSEIRLNDYNRITKNIYCRRLKGGRNNTLEIIDKQVIEVLEKHLLYNNPKYYLFETEKNTKLSRKTLDRHIRKICIIAEIENKEKCHCHTLRHTRAINLIELGCSIYEVQFWLGHVDISNTQIYLTFTSRQQRTLYERLRSELERKELLKLKKEQENRERKSQDE